MAFEEIKDTEWAYFAGVIDGEGCINIRSQRTVKRGGELIWHTLFLQIGNTSYSLLKWVNDRFGGSLFAERRIAGRRQVWHWTAAAKKAEEILRGMLPYLVVKKDQAELALRFRDSYKMLRPCTYRPLPLAISEFRERCKIEMSELKKQVIPENAKRRSIVLNEVL